MLTNKMLHGHKTYSVHIYASQTINKIAEKKRRIHYVYIYTLCPKKGCHQTHGGNFIKSQPIFTSGGH